MGVEAVCTARFNGEAGEGKAMLEGDHLLFRGAFRLKIDFSSLVDVQDNEGCLILMTPSGRAEFELGPLASPWADKIRNPKSRLDKLGIKPDSRIFLSEGHAADFIQELNEAGVKQVPFEEAGISFLLINEPEDLAQIAGYAALLNGAAAMWIVYPKGKAAAVSQDDVMITARATGLTDNKVVGFSSTHTALRYVVPKSKR